MANFTLNKQIVVRTLIIIMLIQSNKKATGSGLQKVSLLDLSPAPVFRVLGVKSKQIISSSGW